jgi:hypothetical protein
MPNLTTSSLIATQNAIIASTTSLNGTYLWLYNGQQADMGVSQALLQPGSSGFNGYSIKRFDVNGVPAWNAGYPSMGCMVDKLWYIVRYYQVSGSTPMAYTSFIIDLSDDR